MKKQSAVNKKQSLKQAFKDKFFKWVDARMAIQPQLELRQKNIYILPTRYGWLMLAIIILILVASTNYQNNMGFMAGFIMLALGLLATFYTYRNMHHLKISVLKPAPVFVGEQIQFPIKLHNPSELPRSSIGLGVDKKSETYVNVGVQNETVHTLEIKAYQRGYFVPKRFVCSSIFPFGIFQVWSWFRTKQQALIYPKPIKAPRPLTGNASGEQQGTTTKKGNEDFYSIKDYQPGDSIKQVMWKAYARERGLLTKEFEEKVGETLIISWLSVAHYEKELAISYLTAEVLAASEADLIFGLELPQQTIELAQGPKQLHQCLKALALF